MNYFIYFTSQKKLLETVFPFQGPIQFLGPKLNKNILALILAHQNGYRIFVY